MKHLAFLFGILALIAMPISYADKVDVGLYVLNLGRFDVATGSFTADFYLSLKCESKCSPDLEFMNGRAISIDKAIDLPNEKFYRIQANLNSPVDLRNFPFDTQKMQIIMEDKRATIDEINYSPLISESGIDDSNLFTGWNILGWKAETKEHEYSVYNETYSQYIFSIGISRIKISAFLKTFLPVFFIILIVMFTFIMDPDKITTRLTVASSSLVAAVMFHINISNQIPPVGYLTFADKFMILTYFILLSFAILNVVILELQEQKKNELAEKMHRATEYSIFIFVPIIYLLFFLFLA